MTKILTISKIQKKKKTCRNLTKYIWIETNREKKKLKSFKDSLVQMTQYGDKQRDF